MHCSFARGGRDLVRSPSLTIRLGMIAQSQRPWDARQRADPGHGADHGLTCGCSSQSTPRIYIAKQDVGRVFRCYAGTARNSIRDTNGDAMLPKSTTLRTCAACWLTFSLGMGAAFAQGSAAAAPRMQLPADQRAFKAARSTMDPAQRLAALQEFVKDYPKSTRAGTAQSEILKVLIRDFPQRSDEIDAQARLLVKKNGGKGMGKYQYESYIADTLANEGLDLQQAGKWASDAVKHMTEPAFDKNELAMYAKYKQPAPKPAAMHKDFAENRANALAALAQVSLHENRTADAQQEVAEASGLDPKVDEVNALAGELALAQHHDAEALSDFERAQLLGELKAPLRDKMIALYRAAHDGSDAGLVSEMDAKYRELYPPPFQPTKAAAAMTGHTVLLELFTGSACPPCVGGDLAAEGLLEAYPRSEVVMLAFDQHIPEPDPLANPDSVAEAELRGVGGTPSYALDGTMLPFYGAGRDGSSDLYGKLVKPVNDEASRPSAVDLRLHAMRGPDGVITVHAAVRTGDAKAVAAQEAQPVLPKPPATGPAAMAKTAAAPAKPAVTPPAAAPQPVLHVALVEDEVRYSGENGIRFHRMVVRAIARGSDFSLAPGSDKSFDTSFDPSAISRGLASYLTAYANNNDRFGKVTFLSTDTTIDAGHLAVAAWVEDAATHRVLQAAFVPVQQGG